MDSFDICMIILFVGVLIVKLYGMYLGVRKVTEDFLAWFDKNFPVHLWPSEEERQEVKTYTWLAWRDALRSQ